MERLSTYILSGEQGVVRFDVEGIIKDLVFITKASGWSYTSVIKMMREAWTLSNVQER